MQTPFHRASLTHLTTLVAFGVFAVATAYTQQSQPPSQGPAVSVSCPSECPKINQDIRYDASITGSKFDGLTIKWWISDGRIISGQGTPSLIIRVDSECRTVTATVAVYGLAESPLTASCTTVTDCCGGILPAQKFDEYGDVSCEQEQAHLDGFKKQLDNQPGARGYIIFYGGRLYDRRLPRRDESESRSIRIRSYAPLREWIESERVVVVNGGFRETWIVELWIVPAGSMAPPLTPTIDAAAIKFRPGAVRKDEYKCP